MSKRANRNFKKRQAEQKAVRENFLITEGRPYSKSFDLEARPLNDWPNVDPDKERGITVEPEPKGMPGGRCNVTACQRPNSAIFLNLGQIGAKHPDTGGCYYCVDCARDIHNANSRWSEQDGMTLFPMFDEMMARYKELWRSEDEDGVRGTFKDRKDRMHDLANYSDINQNPWGSCYHFDRDKYLEKQNDNSNRDAGEA